MSLRLYADECVDARVVAALRRRHIDILTAQEANLLGASDRTHMKRATELGRVILTNDDDFLRLAHEDTEAGEGHPGVLFVLPQTRLRERIRALVLVAEVLDEDDMRNWIEWIP